MVTLVAEEAMREGKGKAVRENVAERKGSGGKRGEGWLEDKRVFHVGKTTRPRWVMVSVASG